MLLNEQRILVVEEFLRDYALKITGSDIARKKKLNQKSTANILHELEEDGFLMNESEGKNKYYSLQKADKEILLHFILVIEHLRTIRFYKENTLIKEVITKIKPLCKGILIIFGSYAKGKQKKDSDLDIFLVGKYDIKEIKKIGERYGMEINIKQYSLSVFKNAPHAEDYLIKEVLKDHILVNNAEEFVLLCMEK